MTLKSLFIAVLAAFPFALQAMDSTQATPAPVAEQAKAAEKVQDNHRVAPVTIQEEAVKIQEATK